MRWALAVGACVAVLPWGGACQAQGRIEVVADLVALFGSARATDSTAAQVRRPATSGSVRQPGIMLHPPGSAKPARLTYRLPVPRAAAGGRALLAFDYGISDGARLDDERTTPDGVRFAVEVAGRPVFEASCKVSRFQPAAVDLTRHAGRTVDVALLVYSGANPAYDWALWGRPRVLLLSGPMTARVGRATDIAVGAAVYALRPGSKARIRVSAIGTAETVQWDGAAGATPAWVVLDYQFPRARGARVSVEPADAVLPGTLRLAEYPPDLRIRHVTADRSVTCLGQVSALRVEVANRGPGLLRAGRARVALEADGALLGERSLPRLGPDANWVFELPWRPRRTGAHRLRAVVSGGGARAAARGTVTVFPAEREHRIVTVGNRQVRLRLVKVGGGYAYGRLQVRRGSVWRETAVWNPLMSAMRTGDPGEAAWEMRPAHARVEPGGRAARLEGRCRDATGVTWRASLRVAARSTQPLLDVSLAWQVDRATSVRALHGPNIYVGDGTTGERKTWALFPGLEYLYRGEVSSSPRDLAAPLHDRRTPTPQMVSIPLMAVTVGPDSVAPPVDAARFYCPDSAKDMPPAGLRDARPDSQVTVALWWDPMQAWDGGRRHPSPRFASPNHDEGMRNHRLALFLPSVPDFVPANGDRARTPYPMRPGRPVTLRAALAVESGPVLSAVRAWVRARGGLPRPAAPPHSWERVAELCRTGFMRTVWNEATSKWRTCIEFEDVHAPGFAALMWMDARLASDAAARRASAERVEQAAQAMLADGGPATLASRAGCHIMRWEFPFLYGHLPEALDAAEAEVRGIMAGQQPDGGWRFSASDVQHADLGQVGDSVLGSSCHHAWMLMRYARLSGDADALAAGEKALAAMERYRLPRGAGPWECPIYEPDVLAAAWALPAYLEGWLATGRVRWLHDAVYWAETGVPFVYLWSLPDRPMMLGSTLPVFGSTFYTHSWLAMPVQWEGLVYAYHLRRLADALERARPAPGPSPLRPVMGFAPADWRRLAELQTVSGAHQQVPDGERVGTYPDSISDFCVRNPVFLSPENLMVNVLAAQGNDPDVSTVRLEVAGRGIVISSGARVSGEGSAAGQVRFRLRHFRGDVSHTLVAGVDPTGVTVNGVSLPRLDRPNRREPGWWFDSARGRLYVSVRHARDVADVTVLVKGPPAGR